MASKIYSNMSLMVEPTAPEHLVNRKYVDNAISKKVKDPVRVVTIVDLDCTYDTTDMTLTQNVPAALVIDGITLNVGDRVLVAAQNVQTQNGIYTVKTLYTPETSDGAGDAVPAVLERASDFDADVDIIPNCIIHVMEGQQNADVTWVLVNDSSVDLDTDVIRFSKLHGADGALAAKAEIEGDGVKTEFVVNHGLDTTNVTVSIYDEDNVPCFFNVKITDGNNVTISSDSPIPNGDKFTVVVLGG